MTFVHRAAALLLAGTAVISPAWADADSEAMLRDLVASIDALQDWTASAGTIRSDGDATIAEKVVVSRGDPRVVVTLDDVRVLDLSAREGSGFSASEIMLTGGKLESDLIDYSVPAALASEISMPSFAGVTFDTHRLMTSVVALYSGIAESEIGELSVPKVTASKDAGAAGDPAMDIVYENMTFSGLSGGVLARQQIGPMVMRTATPEGEPVEIDFGTVLAERFDIGALVHILDDSRYVDGRGDGIWRPLISRVVYSGLSGRADKDSTFRMDEFAVENVDGRQPEKPMRGAWDRLLDPSVPEEAKNDLALEALQTMFAAWRVSTIRLQGIGFEAPADNASGSLDSFTASGLSNAGLDSLIMKEMSFEAPDGFADLTSFELAGFVFPDLDALMRFAALDSETDPAKHAETVKSSFAALPRIAHFGFSGLAAGKAAAEAVKVGQFSLDFANWNEFFAAETDMRLEGLEIPRALMTLDEPTAAIFDSLGLDPIVAGMSLSDRWSPEAGTDDATWTVSLQDAGEIALSYNLIGVTKDWVTSAIAAAGKSEDGGAAMQAMFDALALKGAEMRVTDRSMLDRGFAAAAKQQGLTIDGPTYRAQIRAALIFMLPAALPADLSKLLSAPLRDFLAGGQTLVVTMNPAEPLPLPDLAAAAESDPMGLPNRLNLTLRSEAAP